MENAFQSSRKSDKLSDQPPPIGRFQREPGLTRHIRIVAALLILQGVLELVAAFVIVFGEAFYWATANGMALVMLCLTLLIAPALHITAGIKNYRFQGKVLGVVALACWQITSFWCSFTAFALAVYGIIVYLNRSSSTAFRLGEAGHPVDEILAVF